MADRTKLPGSGGEHRLQETYGTKKRAAVFYERQMLDRLNADMREFIARMEMVFIATSDGHGECDASFRAGLPGFVQVLDDRTVAYPEYRGNGVLASLGNISENPHIGLMFVDFFKDTIGLHINGRARIVDNEALLTREGIPESICEEMKLKDGRKPERWVVVEVEEAYIHCSKHIPRLKKLDKEIHWGTDSMKHKGGDYFKVRPKK